MNLFHPSQEPLAISLLLLPESSMMTLASTLDPMRAANRLANAKLFSWKLYTPSGAAAALSCDLSISVDGPFNENVGGDLLIVVAGFNCQNHVDPPLLKLIRQSKSRFQATGGVEAGAWILAMAGLLDGKKATTHWEDLEDFATHFCHTKVQPDRFVIDGDIFTTGGASPTFDFMLHLIRSRFGQPLALEVASVFIYDQAHAATDAQPLISLGRISQYEPRVTTAIRLMESHIDEPLVITEIAAAMGASSRTLEGLFRKTLDSSPGVYYLRLRLQTARKMVLDTNLPLMEIAVRTGFSCLSSFSRCFKRHYQKGPRDYRMQRLR